VERRIEGLFVYIYGPFPKEEKEWSVSGWAEPQPHCVQILLLIVVHKESEVPRNGREWQRRRVKRIYHCHEPTSASLARSLLLLFFLLLLCGMMDVIPLLFSTFFSLSEVTYTNPNPLHLIAQGWKEGGGVVVVVEYHQLRVLISNAAFCHAAVVGGTAVSRIAPPCAIIHPTTR